MNSIETLTLALGASWASGINLYATILLLGGLDAFGLIDLPENLQVLSSWWVLIAALIFYGLEFFADKIPGVDSLWDMIHTFIRIPAGAMMASGALSGLDGLGITNGMPTEIETIGAMVLGGTVAAGAHATKAGSRAAINMSPEPFSNIGASLAEDVLVISGLVAALFNPIIFAVIFCICLIFAIWIVPKIWRGLRCLFGLAKHPSEALHGQGTYGAPGSGPAGPQPAGPQPAPMGEQARKLASENISGVLTPPKRSGDGAG